MPPPGVFTVGVIFSMRFDRALRRIGRDITDNDPGCAYDVLQRVGNKRFADGLSCGFNWKIRVQYVGPLTEEWNDDIHGVGEGFVESMLCVLIGADIFPMLVSFYKSGPDEPYDDVFECLIDTANYDYEWVYHLFEDDDNVVVVREIPWQDFCDVRRQMCTDHCYYFWSLVRFCSGAMNPYSYLLGPCPALPKIPAPAA